MLRTNFNNSELEVYKKAIFEYTKKYNDYRLSISSVATYGNNNILTNSSSLHDSENSDLTKFWNIFDTVKEAYEAQEALGVSVNSCDVFAVRDGNITHLTRVEAGTLNVISSCNIDGSFFTNHGTWASYRTLAEITPEEITKLIEAEHANGYHWDGKELVKIPEYVECIEPSQFKKQSVIINELNVEIETKDKRIAELEKNLIIMCELGSKVLG